jgi:arylformamidase
MRTFPSIAKVIDISWPMSSSMTAYKDRHIVSFTPTKDFAKDGARETTVVLGTHSGTHVDAPSHFLEKGSSIDQLDLKMLLGPCFVLDLSHVDGCITQAELSRFSIDQGSRILLKTKNSLRPDNDLFDTSFVYLEKSGAQYLVEKKVQAVGIDYLGIERSQPDHATHAMLFQKNIGVIEGLRLKNVEEGHYFLCGFPLKLQGLDAAPARVILIQFS